MPYQQTIFAIMKSYLRILSYTKPYWGQAVLYTLATILSVFFAGLTFVMLQPLLEQLFSPTKVIAHSQQMPEFTFGIRSFLDWVTYEAGKIAAESTKSKALLYVTILIVSLNIISNVFKFFSNYYLGTIRTKVVEDIRMSVFNRLIKLHVGFIEGERKGDIMSRTTSDVTEVEYSVVTTFESIIRDPLSLIYYLALMLMFSVKLTLFIFIVLPIAAILISKLTKSLRRDAEETQATYGQIMSVVDESISGIRIIKAFHAEKYIRNIFHRFNSLYSMLTRRQWHKKALIPIFSESAMVLVFGMVMWYGGNLVYKGEIANASDFITYLGLFFLISRPAKTMSTSFSNIYRGIASANRIFSLMDHEVKILEIPNPKSITDFKDKLVLENISFAYNKELVLEDINLTIEKGKVYALVGASGSGKSTLAELILRFYDPTAGRILIDGYNLRDIQTKDLRHLMAVVTQEAILFNDTIYNNIVFGLKDISEAEVMAAAKAANAHDFIMETENGYQTLIGDRGGLLSGGQRQRLSIARAILRNPPILILDEATSALDTSSEKIVQDALYKLMKNRTSIVIAHRLSTIQEADEIVVLDRGKIIERGNHFELIAMKGIYNGLYKLQQLEQE